MPSQYTTEDTKISKVCEKCGQAFLVPRAWLKKSAFRFCSKECRYADKQKECICLQCGKTFIRSLSAAAPRKGTFCSWECYAASDKKPKRKPSLTISCLHCGSAFHPTPTELKSGAKYCSTDCCNLAKRRPWQERFWDFVEKTDSCWIWTGSRVPNRHGEPTYGKFSYAPVVGEDQLTVAAHRLSW